MINIQISYKVNKEYHIKRRHWVGTVVLNVLMPNVFKLLKYKCSPFLSKGYKRYKLFKGHLTKT